MQRLIKSLTGSSPSNTTIQSSIAEAKSELATVRGNLQHTRQYPQLQTFEVSPNLCLRSLGIFQRSLLLYRNTAGSSHKRGISPYQKLP